MIQVQQEEIRKRSGKENELPEEKEGVFDLFRQRAVSEERSREVKRHLAGCNVCQREFESLKRVSDYVK